MDVPETILTSFQYIAFRKVGSTAKHKLAFQESAMRHEIKLWLVHSIVSVPLNFPYEKFEFYIRNFTSLTPRIVLFLEKSIETFPTLPEQGQIWCYQHVGRFKDTEPVFRVHSENVLVQSMIVQTLLIR